MSAITTHILDTSRGRPAPGVEVTLEIEDGSGWRRLGQGKTDDDGRLRTLLPDGQRPAPAIHRLTFEVAPYFKAHGTGTFFPRVQIAFEIVAPDEHHHVPLLLSPFGYSTYRGS
jgi:5-hydroxyisourate hydrolase